MASLAVGLGMDFGIKKEKLKIQKYFEQLD